MSKPNNIDDCEDLYFTASMIDEIENPTNEEILDSALSFYDSAICYDNNGDRTKSAKSYTLAGEFYLTIEDHAKAAECYGKAILRNLMINNLEAAKVILDKAEEYGDIFDTFHFRMAKDSFSRQFEDDVEEDELKELEHSESLFDSGSIDYDLELPSNELDTGINLELEEIDISEISESNFFTKSGNLEDTDTYISSIKGFSLAENASTISGSESSYSESLAYNLLKTTREQAESKNKILTASVAKNASGFIKDLESGTKLLRKDEYRDRIGEGKIVDIDKLSDSNLDNLDQKLEDVDLDLNRNIDSHTDLGYLRKVDEALTLESEFINVSEISADIEDLEDVEIQDTIPFTWQIQEIDTGGFELQSKDIDQETGSLVFTWKREKLARGETARIKYTLRRRMERSIVMISKKRIYVLNSFHSINEENDVGKIKIEFNNPYNEQIEHLLIEDIIPDEVKVIGKFVSNKNTSLQVYSKKEGLVYRWILNEFKPKENLLIEYKVAERPFTRWYEFYYNLNGINVLKVEKIAEPLIEYYDNQYILFYELSPDSTFPSDKLGEIEMKDEIPMDCELISSYPIWFRPTIEINEYNKKFLSWAKINLEGKTRRVCIRIKVKNDYNPLQPIIEFNTHRVDIKSGIKKEEKAEGIIDLRKRMGLALVNK